MTADGIRPNSKQIIILTVRAILWIGSRRFSFSKKGGSKQWVEKTRLCMLKLLHSRQTEEFSGNDIAAIY